MSCIKWHHKIIPILCIAILYSLNSYAQLHLNNTDWKGVNKFSSPSQVTLHFRKDTLVIQNIAGDSPIALFLQKHDTLLIFHFTDKNNCSTDTGYYQTIYQ